MERKATASAKGFAILAVLCWASSTRHYRKTLVEKWTQHKAT